MNLYYLNGKLSGTAVELRAPGVMIGRESDNDIQILISGVSRYHAKLTFSGDHWELSDVGSSNGTFLNKQKITGSAVLKEGDHIQIGDQFFLFAGKPPEGTASEVPAPEQMEPQAATMENVLNPDMTLDALRKHGLFGDRKTADGNEQSPDGNPAKKKGLFSGKRGNLIFTLLVVTLALVGICVFRIIQDQPVPQETENSSQQKQQPFYLKFVKTVTRQDNIFRFEAVIDDVSASFTVDDLVSGRHFTQKETVKEKTLDRLKDAIRETDYQKLQNESGMSETPGVYEKRELVIGMDGNFNRSVVENANATTSFEEIEKAVSIFAEDYDFQTGMMTFEDMIADGEAAFLKAEELFANRQADYSNLRNAIVRYRYAMKCFEQQDPRPAQYNTARKHLEEAQKVYKETFQSLLFNIKRFRELKQYDKAVAECTNMLSLIGTEDPEQYKRWTGYKLAFEKLLKQNKKK